MSISNDAENISDNSHLVPPPARPSSSSSRPITSHRSEETPSYVPYALTPSTGISHFNQKVPPRIPPRTHRTSKPSPTIEQEVPLSTDTKSNSMTQYRRRPPPPPPPPPPSISKTRSSRKSSRSNSNIDTQLRASSVVASRTGTTNKNVPLREEQLLKRSSSADRVGRERWLHHITDSSAINNGFIQSFPSPLSFISVFLGIKLRTSLPNPLQLVSNHFNSMSKLLSATKYAIEHRDEDTVQLFQVRTTFSFNIPSSSSTFRAM